MIHTAFVLGSGPCAKKVTSDLLETGIDVILATAGRHSFPDASGGVSRGGRLTLMETAEVTACRGTAGDFRVTLAANGQPVHHKVGAIVIAEADMRRATQDLYGLTLSDRVVPLSGLNRSLADRSGVNRPAPSLDGVHKAVLLSGLAGESCPAIAAEVMQAAIRLQTEGNIQTYVLTGNLKVAAEGLEDTYRQAKTAGTVFFKFDTEPPEFKQGTDGRVEIIFQDPVIRQPCRLTPDLCVVDETIAPSPGLARVADVFALQTGPDGFVQTDNVHRQTAFTLRKGIFAVGPSRCVQSQEAHLVDAGNAALAVYGLLNPAATDTFAKAEIDSGHCIHCLTCYRLCPYRAVAVDPRPVIAADACAGCGICAAECPRGAIHIEGLAPGDLSSGTLGADSGGATVAPRMVAFCCSRSAAQAAQLAACSTNPMPPGLTIVEVPCAGAISLNHLLSAFRQNADGVLVLSCHTDNCHSENGNYLARMRVAHLINRLSAVGIDPHRLVSASLAANMGREFFDIVSNFETVLVQLGPVKQGIKEREHGN